VTTPFNTNLSVFFSQDLSEKLSAEIFHPHQPIKRNKTMRITSSLFPGAAPIITIIYGFSNNLFDEKISKRATEN
jgi:hypothetical protein